MVLNKRLVVSDPPKVVLTVLDTEDECTIRLTLSPSPLS
jgi:hypothetical protein